MIAAQFSLYPLGETHLTPLLEQALQAAGATGAAIEVGQMATVIKGSEPQVFDALRAAFAAVAQHGEVVLVATVSNAC